MIGLVQADNTWANVKLDNSKLTFQHLLVRFELSGWVNTEAVLWCFFRSPRGSSAVVSNNSLTLIQQLFMWSRWWNVERKRVVVFPQLLWKPYCERGLNAVSATALLNQQSDSAHLHFRCKISSLSLATHVLPVYNGTKWNQLQVKHN